MSPSPGDRRRTDLATLADESFDVLVVGGSIVGCGVATLGASEGLLRTLGPGIDNLEAEVVWGVREELALSLDDVLARRMRLAHQLRDRGESIAPRVAELIGTELGWDFDRQRQEVEAFLVSGRREFSVS